MSVNGDQKKEEVALSEVNSPDDNDKAPLAGAKGVKGSRAEIALAVAAEAAVDEATAKEMEANETTKMIENGAENGTNGTSAKAKNGVDAAEKGEANGGGAAGGIAAAAQRLLGPLLGNWKSNLLLGVITLACLALLISIILIVTLCGLTGSGSEEVPPKPSMVILYPRPNAEDQSLIRFRRGSASADAETAANYQNLTAQLQELVELYSPANAKSLFGAEICSDNYDRRPNGTTCQVMIDPLTRAGCSQSNEFGYAEGAPCVFLQFGNISDWIPEMYIPSEMDSDTMPQELQFKRPPRGVYVTCDGQTPADKEKLGTLAFPLEHVYSMKYFPRHTNETKWMAPLVAVKFLKPEPQVALGVTCKLWARNLNETLLPENHAAPEISFNILVE